MKDDQFDELDRLEMMRRAEKEEKIANLMKIQSWLSPYEKNLLE